MAYYYQEFTRKLQDFDSEQGCENHQEAIRNSVRPFYPWPFSTTETELDNQLHPPKSTPHNSKTGYSPELSTSALDSSQESLRWQSKDLLWI
jgi:hypothetical protein